MVGGAASAVPTLNGGAVATGSVSSEAVLMCELIFMWTPPHFWALALFVKADYGDAGVPMLTATHGRTVTRKDNIAYCAPLVVVARWLRIPSIGGPFLLVVAFALNICVLTGLYARWRRTASDCGSHKLARPHPTHI